MANFAEFVTSNGILAATAGITIGFATATFIKSFVSDVILPVIFLVILAINRKTGGFVAKFLASKEFRFTNFISEFITWILILLTAYLIIEQTRKYLISSKMTDSNKQMNLFGMQIPSSVPKSDPSKQNQLQDKQVVEPMQNGIEQQFANPNTF